MFSGITQLAKIPNQFAMRAAVRNILRLRISTAAFFMSSRHIPAIFGALVALLIVLSSNAPTDLALFSKAGLFVIAILGLIGNWGIEYLFLKKHMELRNLISRLGHRRKLRGLPI
jgi:hypothetical protein